ncbi:uncharacterized protein Z520_04813 [Fonsecaea multimorphosa CBS 102226]|uniref:Uncharacterized protein n=1 Tax=Fonsecaea multimorphosa CBS 102226 TaxID=1442371 RepID=A0A0D2K093_9EURO|nr:uncharacterized protein Z520_04813 [Fonsecaea multimorphosa CBS 102226]KIX99237.1 hypothetical protein Z520_04813 [Fonsecaea multimorphosa CBS 102226]OAL25931.1 hypothetical protein AYO22_04558 [Fonsecaea multimorphosa]
MQKSTSQSRGSVPGTDPAPSLRDPRLRGRVNSMHVAEVVDAVSERISGSRNEDKPSTSTLQRTTASEASTPSNQHEHPELEKAFYSYVANAVRADYWTRRRDFLRNERKGAQQDHEREQKRSSQFPIVVEQALQKKNQIEAAYQEAKGETNTAIAMVQDCVADFRRLLLNALDTEKEQLGRTVTNLLGPVQQDIKDLRSHQADSSTLSRSQYEELESRLRNLEESRNQQIKTLDELNNLKRKAAEDAAKHAEAYSHILQQCEELRSSQRASDQNMEETIKALKTDHNELRKSLKSLEQRSTAVESRFQGLNWVLATVSKLKEEVKEAVDQIERVRESLHLRIENVPNELDSKYRNFMEKELEKKAGQLSIIAQGMSEKLNSLNTQYEMLVRGLDTVRADLDHRSSKYDQSQGELSKKLDLIEHQAAESSSGRQRRIDLVAAVESLEQQFVQHTADMKQVDNRLGSICEDLADLKATGDRGDIAKIREEFKCLRTQLAEQANNLQDFKQTFNGGTQSFKGRFAGHDVSSEGSQMRHDHNLAGEVAQVPGEQEELRFSHIFSRLDMLERNQEKLMHLSLYQSQRYDKLASECFTYAMVGPVRKPISKFDYRFDEILHAMEELRNRPEISQEAMDKLVNNQANIAGKIAVLGSKHEDLERRFEETREKMTKTGEDFPTLVGRAETDQSTYRGSADQTITAPQAMADATGSHGLNKAKHPRSSLFANGQRATKFEADAPDAPSRDTNIGAQAVSDEFNGGPGTDEHAAHQVSDDDDQDIEKADAEMLKKFGVTPQSQRASKRQSPQSAAHHSEPTLKRKRAQREEKHVDLTQDSDEADNMPPRRKIRS